MEPETVYLTVNKFVEEHQGAGWITHGSLRRLIALKKKNGFEKAFIKVGKRVLIDVNEFWDIVARDIGEK